MEISNSLTLHLNKLKKEQAKSQISGNKERIKITVEIKEIETRKVIEKLNTTKSFFFFFEKIKNIGWVW